MSRQPAAPTIADLPPGFLEHPCAYCESEHWRVHSDLAVLATTTTEPERTISLIIVSCAGCGHTSLFTPPEPVPGT